MGKREGGRHCCEATCIQMATGNEVTSSKAKGEVGKREGVNTVVKHVYSIGSG